MEVLEFLGNALKANKAVRHSTVQRTLKAVGADAEALAKSGKGEIKNLDGSLGALRSYVNAEKNYTSEIESAINKGLSADEVVKATSGAAEIHGAASEKLLGYGKDKNAAINNIMGGKKSTTGDTVINGLNELKHDEVNKLIDKRISDYRENVIKNPGTLKGNFEQLQKVNNLSGNGTMSSLLDTAGSYLSGADLRSMHKTGELTAGQAIGMGAIRGATVLGGTALTVGAVRGVGHAIFGNSNRSSGGYSY